MGKPYTALLAGRLRRGPIVALAGGAATLPLTVSASYRHSFAAVEFYSDAQGTNVVVPTAGTATFTLVSPLLPTKEHAVTGGVVSATDECIVSWSLNVTTVKAVMDAVVGATHCRIRFIGNIS